MEQTSNWHLNASDLAGMENVQALKSNNIKNQNQLRMLIIVKKKENQMLSFACQFFNTKKSLVFRWFTRNVHNMIKPDMLIIWILHFLVANNICKIFQATFLRLKKSLNLNKQITWMITNLLQPWMCHVPLKLFLCYSIKNWEHKHC